MVEPAFERRGSSPFIEGIDEVGEQQAQLARSERGRRLANGDRAGTESLDDQAELFEEPRMREEPGAIGRVEIDDFRRQHDLPLDPARRRVRVSTRS